MGLLTRGNRRVDLGFWLAADLGMSLADHGLYFLGTRGIMAIGWL
jgi:hypothetical protein